MTEVSGRVVWPANSDGSRVHLVAAVMDESEESYGYTRCAEDGSFFIGVNPVVPVPRLRVRVYGEIAGTAVVGESEPINLPMDGILVRVSPR
jgi:hypothetical protein